LVGRQGEKESLEEFIRRIESVSGGYDYDGGEEEAAMQSVSGQNLQGQDDMIWGFPHLGINDTRMARLGS
jgi:hypothetical protein